MDIKVVTKSERFDHYLVVTDQTILADVIIENYEEHAVQLHFCVFNKNDVGWWYFFKNRLVPELPDDVHHVFMALNKENKARVKLFQSWGFDFKWNDEADMFIFHYHRWNVHGLGKRGKA